MPEATLAGLSSGWASAAIAMATAVISLIVSVISIRQAKIALQKADRAIALESGSLKIQRIDTLVESIAQTEAAIEHAWQRVTEEQPDQPQRIMYLVEGLGRLLTPASIFLRENGKVLNALGIDVPEMEKGILDMEVMIASDISYDDLYAAKFRIYLAATNTTHFAKTTLKERIDSISAQLVSDQ